LQDYLVNFNHAKRVASPFESVGWRFEPSPASHSG
jgi:hypothetical protein